MAVTWEKNHSLSKIAEVLGLPEDDLKINVSFSPGQRTHRYVWRLRWSDRKPLLVVALIPSRADKNHDDPTVRKCIEIGARKHGELVMVNVFAAWPTTDHAAAAVSGDLVNPVGRENDRHIRDQASRVREAGGTTVAAWGDDGWSRHAEVISLLGPDVQCFGKTGKGFPMHASLRGIAARDVKIRPY